MLEATAQIQELSRKGAKIFYWSSGQEIRCRTTLEKMNVVFLGVGHEMELEAIRGRTKESLRERVRSGFIAGGRCYGYELVRRRDHRGEHTEAVIDAKQAEVVCRIFREYQSGRGLKAICKDLNRDGVPGPRGGDWAPSAIRPMLRNPRYRGLYVHGRVNRTKRGGRRVAEKASAGDVLIVEMPSWRIINDNLWDAVAARFSSRVPRARNRNAARYSLSGIGRCGVCRGPITVARTLLSRDSERARIPAYGCGHHRERATCHVTMVQPVTLVDAAVADSVRQIILSPDVLEEFWIAVRENLRTIRAVRSADHEKLKAELTKLQQERRRLVKLAAQGQMEVAEVAEALDRRTRRSQDIEVQLGASAGGPTTQAEKPGHQLESAVREKLNLLADALALDPAGARDVYKLLFPKGLTFLPTPEGFRITGRARLDSAVRDVTPPGHLNW